MYGTGQQDYSNLFAQNYNAFNNPSEISGFNQNSSQNASSSEAENAKEERRRKRKSRWGGEETDKTSIPGMPTVIPTNLSKEQEQAYLYQLQIEEINRKLRSGDLGIPANPEERSPSPEPIYSSDGKRMNTREYRTRKKLEEERHELIQNMLKVNPEFKPPPDYKPPVIKVNDKVMIPQDEHPDINFVGLLIGPRGNTLKSMEKDTGAKIIIRGKGSVKEGKVGRKDGQPLPGENEPLHAYVTAHNPENVKKAVERIKEIIRQGVEVPEGQNDLRRNQLRELALLNGTLRENDGPRCTNCGATDHRSWSCQDKPNVTNTTLCSSCGGAGHIAKDCREKRPGHGGPGAGFKNKAKIDEEYMSLMAELGEGPPPDKRHRSRDDDDDDRDYGRSRGSRGGSMFNNNDNMMPRAIMAPPPLMGQSLPTPTQLIPNSVPPPPWSNSSGPDSSNNSGSQSNQIAPPWQQGNSSAPQPLMSQPVPPPVNFNQNANFNSNSQGGGSRFSNGNQNNANSSSNFNNPPNSNFGNNFSNNSQNKFNAPAPNNNFNGPPSNFGGPPNMGNFPPQNNFNNPQAQSKFGWGPPNSMPPWQQPMMWPGAMQNPTMASLLSAPPPPPPPPS